MSNDAKKLIEYVENKLRNALETNRLQLLSSKLWIMVYFKIALFKAKITQTCKCQRQRRTPVG